ncbi:hypothetical protein DXT74_12195 [Chromobacterium sp. Rain0013]|nr:hypothetical protein DXT74_12195 [Chromobacterium sp. Rain0013]
MFRKPLNNSFYASCERVFNPGLAGLPIVVLFNSDGSIVSRSAEAKALGVPMSAPYLSSSGKYHFNRSRSLNYDRGCKQGKARRLS